MKTPKKKASKPQGFAAMTPEKRSEISKMAAKRKIQPDEIRARMFDDRP